MYLSSQVGTVAIQVIALIICDDYIRFVPSHTDQLWCFADSDVYVPSRVAQLLRSTPMKNSRYKSGVEISCRSPRSRSRHAELRRERYN